MKLLFAGTVGSLSALHARVSKLNASHGPFDALLVGDLRDAAGLDAAAAAAAAGASSAGASSVPPRFPVPTYFVSSSLPASAASEWSLGGARQAATNLGLLGSTCGLATLPSLAGGGGLRVAS